MTKTIPFLFHLFLTTHALAQCGYTAKLHTNKDYCVGSSLIASSGHALQHITWYHNGQAVKSADGAQSFASTVEVIPLQTGDRSSFSIFNDIGTDDFGNIYVCDNREAAMKWPGTGNSVSFVVPAYSKLYFGSILVDKSGNVYLLDGDSAIAYLDSALVEEWPAGRTDSIVTIPKPIGQVYTYGGARSFAIDCQHNIFIDNLDGNITKWPPGAKHGTFLYSFNNAVDRCNGLVGDRIHLDQAGNIFFSVGNTIVKLTQTKPQPQLVIPNDCQATADIQLSDFWLDANDTIYTTGLKIQEKTFFIEKWAPGATTPETITTWTVPDLIETRCRMTMDVKGNLFVTDANTSNLERLKRTTTLDSAFTPTDTGRYYAVVTDIQGYSTYTDTIVINVPATGTPSIAIAATATSTPVCTPITFTATVANPGPYPNYQWMVSGVPAGDNSTTYSYNLFADGDQVYCILNAQNGCAGPVADTSNIIDLHIDPQGAASVTITTPKDTICKGDDALFTATVINGSNNPAFEWLLNGDSTGDTGPTYESNTLSKGDVITCLITSDDACGLAKSNSIPLFVSTPPTVESGQIITILHTQSTTLQPVTTGDIETWLWTPATGLSDPDIPDPVASPDTNTLYTLKVTAPGGCSATGTILVNVYTPLSIPNAFTPNGDGHNDVLYVLGGPVNSIVKDFAVFDRFGMEVFHVHNVPPGDRHFGWNGRFNGHPAQMGTYVYLVVMQNAKGVEQVYKGTIILVR